MTTHPNRSKKTISVKLTEDDLNWLDVASAMQIEEYAACGSDVLESYPSAFAASEKILKARTVLRSRSR